jgi:hypothetical protein
VLLLSCTCPLPLPQSHLPFSHHKLWPGLTRDKAAAMPFTNITSSIPQGSSPEDQEARPVFCVKEQPPLGTFTYPQGE